MLCSVCREDLPEPCFKPEDYLHARIHCHFVRCLLCGKMDQAERTNTREAALERLGAVTKRMKIAKAHSANPKKIKKGKVVSVIPASSTQESYWKSLSLKEKREDLINRQTPSEMLLAGELLKQAISFDAQVSVGSYFVDFQILPGKLAVEVDGGYHFTPEQQTLDAIRTESIRKLGWTVIRFTNQDVKKNLGRVVWDIREAAKKIKIPRKHKYLSPDKIVVIPPTSFCFGANGSPLEGPMS